MEGALREGSAREVSWVWAVWLPLQSSGWQLIWKVGGWAKRRDQLKN